MYSEGIRVTEITLIPLIAYYARNGMEKEALAHYYRLHSLDGEEVESTMAAIGCIYHPWYALSNPFFILIFPFATCHFYM